MAKIAVYQKKTITINQTDNKGNWFEVYIGITGIARNGNGETVMKRKDALEAAKGWAALCPGWPIKTAHCKIEPYERIG